MKNLNVKKVSIDILMDIIGGILIAIGTYNFAAASEFPMVGFNGIGLILYHLFGMPIGTVAFVLNIPVAIACFKILGRDFFIRSIRTIVITSVIMDLVAPRFPVYEGDLMLSAICTGVLSGLGYALIYMRDSSTGGTDFIMLSIKEYFPHLSLGKISFAMESLVIVAGTVFVSKNIEGLIYGMIISFILSIMVDKVMYGISAGKMALIVTDHAHDVADRIDETVGRGSTFLKSRRQLFGRRKRMSSCAPAVRNRCTASEMW